MLPTAAKDSVARAGLPVTVEVGAHYLVFAAEDIPDGDTHYKCAPPLRERKIQSTVSGEACR